MSEVKRYDIEWNACGEAYMEEAEFGKYSLFTDHDAALAQRDQRIEALERVMQEKNDALALAWNERDALQQETQVTREALNELTTATAMLDLGQEDGDERAVVRNVIVGIRALQQRLGEAQKDAERLDWLSAQHGNLFTPGATFREKNWCWFGDRGDRYSTTTTLRDLINAALSTTEAKT